MAERGVVEEKGFWGHEERMPSEAVAWMTLVSSARPRVSAAPQRLRTNNRQTAHISAETGGQRSIQDLTRLPAGAFSSSPHLPHSQEQAELRESGVGGGLGGWGWGG